MHLGWGLTAPKRTQAEDLRLAQRPEFVTVPCWTCTNAVVTLTSKVTAKATGSLAPVAGVTRGSYLGATDQDLEAAEEYAAEYEVE